jgi:hypothetical protein
MDEFIRREHLIIFKRRLAEVKDDAQRQLLSKLLAGVKYRKLIIADEIEQHPLTVTVQRFDPVD